MMNSGVFIEFLCMYKRAPGTHHHHFVPLYTVLSHLNIYRSINFLLPSFLCHDNTKLKTPCSIRCPVNFNGGLEGYYSDCGPRYVFLSNLLLGVIKGELVTFYSSNRLNIH